MNLYLVTVDSNYLQEKWDVYDSFVVCCKTEKDARQTHPSLGPTTNFNEEERCWVQTNGVKVGFYSEDGKRYPLLSGWIYGKDIGEALTVELLGKAKPGSKKDVIIASYNAG